MTITPHLLDWMQIKQQQALVHAGTPEGAAYLAESKRYGAAADEIQRLRVALGALVDECDTASFDGMDFGHYANSEILDQAREALKNHFRDATKKEVKP